MIVAGAKYNRLTAIERIEGKNGQAMWLCRCECGNTAIVKAYSLTTGKTKSCGCLAKEYRAAQGAAKKHGFRGTRLYNAWRGMKDRCYNKTHISYYDYGKRNIGVCDEWKNSFKAFADWSLANGYREDLTLDRINNYKGYSPDNCRWTTQEIQSKNKRPRSEWVNAKGGTNAVC